MKSQAIEWSQGETATAPAIKISASGLNRARRLAAKVLIAVIPALAIIIGAAWAMTVPSLAIYPQVIIWAAGFIFLGLAIESENPSAFAYLLLTGLALPVLALLSSRVAEEFIVVAAVLIAGWAARLILRR